MTQRASTYLRLLQTATSWLRAPEGQMSSSDRSPERLAFYELASFIHALLSAAHPQARILIKRDLWSLTARSLIEGLREIADRDGEALAIAARDLTRVLLNAPHEMRRLEFLNHELAERSLPLLKDEHLADPSRSPFGPASSLRALIADLITERRGRGFFEQLTWVEHDGQRGLAALSFLAIPLSASERVDLSLLILEGLAEMHQARLEVKEGFAPERMLWRHDLSIFVPVTERTRVEALKSPEQKLPEHLALDHLDKHSDVWSVVCLFKMMYQASGIAQAFRAPLTIPAEVQEVLERGLKRDPSERFHSGRELRVVLDQPLSTWRARLHYEERQKVGIIDSSLTFEQITLQETKSQEARAKRRRGLDLKIRKRLRGRATLKQLLWSVFILVVAISAGWAGWRAWNKMLDAQIAPAIAHRAELQDRDHRFDQVLPQKNKEMPEVIIHWREVKVGEKGNPALVSVSHITSAQYAICVNSGVCTPSDSEPHCVVEPSNRPQNCIDIHQAQKFAQFAQADLLTVQDWLWLALKRGGARPFPWGHEEMKSAHAALKWNPVAQDPTQPFEVCSYPLGDSADALCDLIGNVKEWVLVPSQVDHNSQERDHSLPDIAGVMGGAWTTRPPQVKPEIFSVQRPETRSPEIGFRLIRRKAPPKR